MTENLSLVTKIASPVAAITLTTVCADVDILQGEGTVVEISAQTPNFWSVTDDGRITEVGGPVAEALKQSGTSVVSGNSAFMTSFSSGWIDGVFYINNRPVTVPDPRERLVVYVPANYAGDLVIDAKYFGAISIDARLQGQVKAQVSMRVSLKMVDQSALTGAKLEASSGASIKAGLLTSKAGRVKLSASSSDSLVEVGEVSAAEIVTKASSGAQVIGKDVTVTGTADFEASSSGSRIEVGIITAAEVEGEASSGAKLIGKNVTVTGTADFTASSSNSGIEFDDLSAGKVVSKASSGGHVIGKKVTCAGSVDLNASSSNSLIVTANVRAGQYTARGTSGGQVLGKNVSCKGNVDLTATSSGSLIELGSVSAVKAVTNASSGGKVKGKFLSVRKTVEIKASSSGSRVTMDDVWAEALDLEGGMSGCIDLGNADVIRLTAEAGMSSEITVRKGSAESGSGKASMSARVNLTGDFGAIVKAKESMSGRVHITVIKGDAGDRFTRAAKRNFNRDLWDDSHASAIALTIGGSMGPALQQGMAEALADDTFVSLVCKAMGPTYRDEAVLVAIRKCGTAFSEVLGTVEDVTDPQAAAQAIQAPAVTALFGPAFQLFLTTAFDKVKTLVS